VTSRRRDPSARFIAADDESLGAAFDRMAHTMSSLRPGESLVDLVTRGPEIILENVTEIARATEQADAFDVIELMRLRETPMMLDGYRESLADQMPAAVELVGQVLLARGQRVADGANVRAANPAKLIPELHERAGLLFSVAQFTRLHEGQGQKYGPLTSLAATYVGHELSVRFKQYAHFHDSLNEALFATSSLGSLLLDVLGFSYEDFVKVRQAIREVYLERFFAARDVLGDVSQEWSDGGRQRQSPERIAQGRAAVEDLMVFPGRRAAFRVEDIAGECDVASERVERILARFSVEFLDRADPVEAVTAFLNGDNPFQSASLINDGEGNYLSLNVPIGTDCFRQVVEAELKLDPTKWRRYERRRVKVSEESAVGHLAALLGTEASAVSLKYFRPNPGIDPSRLGPSATQIVSFAEQTEADALFIVEDVAICVEVKGRSVSSQARGGHVQRLSADLRATVGEATNQALRLEELIRTNGGLWREDQTWLDLSSIREVRSVAVCLDDMGPLATALDELVRANVLGSDRFPWIVSLHDLAIVAEVLDRPAEFLLYLRRRTESEVSLKYSAIDELDLFMLFLAGGLFVEPDPDRVSEEFLGVPRPSGADRRRYRSSAVPTRVMTHTDALDAWIYFQEGSSETETEKPRFASNRAVLALVDFLQDGHKPGWFRFSADLLNLADEGQEAVSVSIQELTNRTRKDNLSHSAFLAFAGSWGYPLLFFGTKPAKMSQLEASQRLAVYGVTKKHQLKSDRALMVLIDESGVIRSVRYDNRKPEENSEMDELAIEVGLIPAEVMGRPVPPSARRSTKRLNPRGATKRRR
jgi:hypothetical protein